MFCIKCGEKLQPEAKFCGHCGSAAASLSRAAAPAPTPEPDKKPTRWKLIVLLGLTLIAGIAIRNPQVISSILGPPTPTAMPTPTATSTPTAMPTPTATSTPKTSEPGVLDPPLRFTYDLPAGWEEVRMPGQRYKSAFGPATHNFAPNIAWSDGMPECGDALSELREECTRIELEAMKELLYEFEVIEESVFPYGWKIVVEHSVVSDSRDARVRATLYYFGASHKFLLGAYSRSADVGQRFLDVPVEQSILSVRMLD